MIWKRHGGTERATEAMAGMVMEWCLMSQMTEEHRSIMAVDMIERGTIPGTASAGALSHLCLATDPTEIDILRNVRAAAELVGGCLYVFTSLFVCCYRVSLS